MFCSAALRKFLVFPRKRKSEPDEISPPGQRLGETALILGAQRGSREVVVGLLEEKETDITATNVSSNFSDNMYKLN